MRKDEIFLKDILALADIKINGNNAWDIKVKNDNFYRKVLAQGSLGLGESYMDGWWECDDLDELFFKILKAELEHKIIPLKLLYMVFKSKLLNLQSKKRSSRDVGYHYNLGNILFQNMLDKHMTYSCAYWKNANTLDQAQEAKLKLICDKIYLKSGMTLLDVGCGWGSLMKYAAQNYGTKCTGITLSQDQVELGSKLCEDLPIDIQIKDYRDIKGEYDRVVSVGMIEHVGSKNYKTFFKIINNCLKDDGLFLLHTIGTLNPKTANADPWTNKYIFPGGELPTAQRIAKAAEGLFVMEDWHNFGIDYSKTTKAWFENFNRNWEKIKSENYDERFYRMWKYFLLSQSGAFRARRNHLWQIVFSKHGVQEGYTSVR
ncbi:MAG: cyclopropane-fatty-acyl-phospholipid synthase [Ignavibacteria bacterium RIFOXYB2_FULL_35_12]|nr:MAG: cyclopropane-fatty-acyl-phospholipid synthase [Ignavibacteria bacterium GWA2_36_19]OGU60221.1 MAG: cyclopropane-fatty-acyl-phospholipid synthase [Ignavibacteria bacterium GWF2_35_20]OGU79110.1 MAG: cyclopropane-fatty-acyl-phospholipid synthase [Ignavibacteria bacterium RIFOXYA2_FULL_35_9]OGU94812.1 MAG: cyclopropane-fatty-acyl-phospholipid synthase [Ignavibacteria bacterium RIFOXYB12_FULL_35_14]OGU98732.1 MAG: cyclopropane-fatty-acyl-phospholipid synthase [Ignavibacteria bacterium RIFOX